MSAFILGNDTLDLLITAGLYGSGIDGALRVYHGGEFTYYNKHEHADEVGSILKTANYDSVNYRYKEATPCEAYRYNAEGIPQYLGGVVIPWGQVLQTVRCYDYQSCEAPTWEGSLAKAISEAITRKVCGFIVSQCEAEWDWSRNHATAKMEAIREGLKTA